MVDRPYERERRVYVSRVHLVLTNVRPKDTVDGSGSVAGFTSPPLQRFPTPFLDSRIQFHHLRLRPDPAGTIAEPVRNLEQMKTCRGFEYLLLRENETTARVVYGKRTLVLILIEISE